jgi:hypothetical protein
MNTIVMMTLLCTIAFVIFMIIYLTPYFSKKQIKNGKFDILQFINLFFAPILVIPFFYYLRKIIFQNLNINLIRINSDIFDLVFLFILYFLVLGNSIHSVCVILSKHMKDIEKHKVWKINEFFHNTFSHFFLTVSAMLMFFLFVILEINRPLLYPINHIEVIILIVCGIIFGIVLGIGSTEGSIPRLMFYIFYMLSMIIAGVVIYHNLFFRHYPYTIFIETTFVTAIITLSFYKYKLKGFPEIVDHIFFDE